MMKLRYLFENFDLARLALSRYPHDEETLDQYLRHFRISSNAVYPYASNGKRCFLRLAPVEEKSFEDIRAEVEYIHCLRQNGYPAMKPIADKKGQWVSVLETPQGRWCASAFEGVSGVPAEEALTDKRCVFEMGASLGRLHALSREYRPQYRRPDHQEILSDIRRMLETSHTPSAVFDRLEELSGELSRLPVTEANYGLLHYDFEPDNVFWDARTQTCSVIDFDDSMYGWFSLDIEQALAELPDKACAEVFLSGYRTMSPYTEEMEAQRPLMRRFILLRAYARLLHCLNDEIADPPEWMKAMCRKLISAKQKLESDILDK